MSPSSVPTQIVFESTGLGAIVYTTPRRVGLALGRSRYFPTLAGTSHVGRDRSSLIRCHDWPPFTVCQTTLVP